MSDNNDKAKLFERIKKVLALTTSPNENEALAATNKLQELLVEYNLTLSDINGNESKQLDNDSFLTDQAAWVKPLLQMIGKLYFCGYFFSVIKKELVLKDQAKHNRTLYAGNHGNAYIRHTFVGEQHNIIIAKNVAEYLISTMERLCREGMKNLPVKEHSTYKTSFMNACTMRLCLRLHERKIQTSACGIKSDGKNLPALRNMYDEAEEKFQKWMEENIPYAKPTKAKFKVSNMKGVKDGEKVGQSIGLDQQLDKRNDRRIVAR